MKDIIHFIIAKADWMKTIVGLVIMVVFSLMVWTIITREIPVANREIIIHVLGIIEGALMAIVTYYYGSSKGSQDKQEIIKKQSEQHKP